MSHAVLKAVEYALPDKILSNQDLIDIFPDWTIEKIEAKTGIKQRHIARSDEYASDFAVRAAEKLFEHHLISAVDIDFILYCTQSPDDLVPTTACILQERLGCSKTTGALDYNLGCSGYVYGLSIAKGLIETGQARNVLLLTADTYSKYLLPEDRAVRTIFGDGGSASWIGSDAKDTYIFPAAFGSDGAGSKHLAAHGFGLKQLEGDESKGFKMNGPEVFKFALEVVPDIIAKALERAGIQEDQIDLYIFHQANQYMLEVLRKKCNIPMNKFVVALSHFGNTVSSTIPIALSEVSKNNEQQCHQYAMLVGFGTGYSWSAAVINLEMIFKS
ncbi:MAG: ketoacyl-ACP synthase III [Gammaproteobacteria bacterium]|nr:ketoacyl-ACP synthase III [Gammaproteobacteria bacterium]